MQKSDIKRGMEQPDHILIVDDDLDIRELLAEYLKKNGFKVSTATNGMHMRAALNVASVDLIVLDLMLPGEDGLALCRELRAGETKAVPILMLTARSDETDRIVGLEMGADDYLTKPFASRELLARIRAVLRRTRMLPPNLRVTESAHMFAFGGWLLEDTSARHLLDAGGTMVSSSGAEYRLLRVFLDHPQRVLNRDQLLNLTQGREAELFDRSIDLLVSRLRQRLLDDARDALLDSLVYDYLDAGQTLRLVGRIGHPLLTRPYALRRIITNLVDNALKFGCDVEILVKAELPGRVFIAVMDRGPGIPQAELEAVLQPFYRIENSRNRESGGTGLGLAIAQQLATALGGVLTLSNRDGGGLQAHLSLIA